MDKDFKLKHSHHKKCCHGMGFAIFLIMIGALFLLLNTGVIPPTYKPLLASWQMLLIAFGVWSLFKKQYLWGGLLMSVGGFFIFPILSRTFPEYFNGIEVSLHQYVHTYWSILLIIVGVFLVLSKMFPSLSPKCKWQQECNDSKSNNSFDQYTADRLDKNSVFGSSEQIVLSQNFRGGEANIVFGELILDLRKAKLAEGSSYLELNVVFGSIIAYVPTDWVIELQSDSVMGSFVDKRHDVNVSAIENRPRLVIKGSCVFGGGEIRN